MLYRGGYCKCNWDWVTCINVPIKQDKVSITDNSGSAKNCNTCPCKLTKMERIFCTNCIVTWKYYGFIYLPCILLCKSLLVTSAWNVSTIWWFKSAWKNNSLFGIVYYSHGINYKLNQIYRYNYSQKCPPTTYVSTCITYFTYVINVGIRITNCNSY